VRFERAGWYAKAAADRIAKSSSSCPPDGGWFNAVPRTWNSGCGRTGAVGALSLSRITLSDEAESAIFDGLPVSASRTL
jgi:hypothetical protein